MSDPKNFYITSIFLKPMIILEVYKVIYFFCITADEFRRLFNDKCQGFGQVKYICLYSARKQYNTV